MAQYKRKYRDAIKQATSWMTEDEIPPVTEKCVNLPFHNVSDEQLVSHNDLELSVTSEALTEVLYDEPLSSCDDANSDDDIAGDALEADLDDGANSDADSAGDSLQADLAEFMVQEGLTRKARNKLLALLRKHGHNLPKDSRTLTNTPRVVDVINKCGGQYVYFGITKCLQLADSSCDVFYLTVNIDGIPVYKSTNVQFWPILCSINSQTPVIVALYVGNSKPTSVHDFLADFVNEVAELQANGFVVTHDNSVKPVVLRGFVCDAPARAFIKNIKGHNSLSGCERCIAQGVSVSSRTTFCSPHCYDAEKRRNDKFVRLEYAGSHQFGATPLFQIAHDCISMCALDYMHLVCLGAVRRMLMYWKKGDRRVKLSSSQLLQISEKLVALRDFIPSEFARRPRSLVELDRWKATEYRQFLLYTGPVVLKSVLSADIYKHFLCLSVGVHIMLMSDQSQREHYFEYACKLVHHFVSTCERFYGTEFVVYNIHSLLHLGDDVKFFEASLDEISSFPFENFLQTVKRLIRSPSNPIVQVVKRIQEYEYASGPLNSTRTVQKQCKLSAGGRDSVVLLKNGKFAEIVEKRDDALSCAVYKRTCLQPFFTEPCASDTFNIVYVSQSSGNTYLTDILHTDIGQKAMKLPHGNGYVLMPLIHNE